MRFKGVIFDLDGTIYLGDRLIPGADKVVQTLREQDKQVVFLSNKPIEPRSAFAEKLTRLGIPTPADDVINSSLVAADFFAREMAGARVFCIGEPPLRKELDDAGLGQAQRPEHTDLVLISLDRDLSYDKIHFAYHAAKAGAKVWATNPDLVCPMPDDEIIDAGATIAALEALLRRPIDGLIGKPSQMMVSTILKHMGLPAQACLMVGDRLETDIAMGKRAGMAAAVVLTGVTKRYMLEGNPVQPDYVLESVQGVLGL